MMRPRRLLLTLIVLTSPVMLLAQAPQTPSEQSPAPAGRGTGGRGGAPTTGTVTTAAAGRGTPAPPLQISTDLTGWTSMFDGVSLEGWDGPMPLWHVEDGAIAVRRPVDPPHGSVYLIWQGGQPRNFELKLEVKLEGAGANSGVQFRAMLLGEVPDRPLVAGYAMTKWESHGYQADMTNLGGAGNLINCCNGPRRGPPRRLDASASSGQVTRSSAATDGGSRELLALLDDPATLRGHWRPNDWNQLHIVARGRMMMYIVNGHVASVLFDDHPTLFRPQGYIAIQLEGAAPNAAWFRNLWIKHLPD